MVCRASILALVALAGCSPWVEESVEGLRSLTGTVRSNRRGLAKVRVDVEPGETSLLLTAAPKEDWAYAYRLYDDAREVLYDQVELANARMNLAGGQSRAERFQFSWPILEEHPALDSSRRLDLLVGTTNRQLGSAAAFEPKRDVDLTVWFKVDDDLSSGVLDTNVILVGELASDAGLRAQLDLALEEFQAIYSAIDLELNLTIYEVDDQEVSAPGQGTAAFWEQISGDTPVRSVNVVLVHQEIGDVAVEILGIAGGIPGPLGRFPNAGVAVSTLLHSGTDGALSPAESRILGQTMAHEVGHHVGLFHPVEVIDSTTHDALDDTDDCEDLEICEETIGANMMFPYPVCDFAGCLRQADITPRQAATAQRYVGVQ